MTEIEKNQRDWHEPECVASFSKRLRKQPFSVTPSTKPYLAELNFKHSRATRFLSLALRADCPNAWQELGRAFETMLTRYERGAISCAALLSLPSEYLTDILEASEHCAGPPVPPLFSYSDEAATWADYANERELKAYLLAAFNRMSPPDQLAFFNYLKERLAP